MAGIERPIPAAQRRFAKLRVHEGGSFAKPRNPHTAAAVSSPMTRPRDHLTDYLNGSALQRIQDRFVDVTGLEAVVLDAEGHRVTRPSRPRRPTERVASEHGTTTAHIAVDGRRLGSLVLTGRVFAAVPVVVATAQHAGEHLPLEPSGIALLDDRFDELSRRAEGICSPSALLQLIADTISQLCRQGQAARQRVREMATLYDLSNLLAVQRDLKQVLTIVAREAVKVMRAKAASIRLIDEANDALQLAAVHGVSDQYLTKGPTLERISEIDREAMTGKVVYVPDMAADPRVLYPQDAVREGLTSILCAGMVYRGKSIGVMRIYTAKRRRFTKEQKNLLLALAQLAGAAIRNAELDAERARSERIARQIEFAADVQRYLLPRQPPQFDQFDVAGRYEPSFELSGDFFDFIPLQSSLGVAVGDVVGKGVAAGLLMASVRASMRAHIEDIYHIEQVMARVNDALCRDTRDFQFATVFYATIDAATLRMTCCSAGHDPALLLRGGGFIELNANGMALGIDPAQTYEKAVIDLHPGDVLLIYTDGVTDAMNFQGERFGLRRVKEAMIDAAGLGARQIVDHVYWQINRFIGLNRRSDDLTLVAVKVV